jgi:hypothetical protein
VVCLTTGARAAGVNPGSGRRTRAGAGAGRCGRALGKGSLAGCWSQLNVGLGSKACGWCCGNGGSRKRDLLVSGREVLRSAAGEKKVGLDCAGLGIAVCWFGRGNAVLGSERLSGHEGDLDTGVDLWAGKSEKALVLITS